MLSLLEYSELQFQTNRSPKKGGMIQEYETEQSYKVGSYMDG